MKTIMLLITIHAKLSIYNSNGDLNNNAGINFQILYAQKQHELIFKENECNKRISDLTQQITNLKGQLNQANITIGELTEKNKRLGADNETIKNNISIIYNFIILE